MIKLPRIIEIAKRFRTRYDERGELISSTGSSLFDLVTEAIVGQRSYSQLREQLGPDNYGTVAAAMFNDTSGSSQSGIRRGRWFRRILTRELGLPRFVRKRRAR